MKKGMMWEEEMQNRNEEKRTWRTRKGEGGRKEEIKEEWELKKKRKKEIKQC
jgi:hypothetical protein